MNISLVPSPNFTTGRINYKPIAIVIHIMEGSLSGTDSWFASTISNVSAHYGVGVNGDIHQYVKETDSAWHAGRINAPSWSLIKSGGNGLFVNPNFYTIGIEHEGSDQTDWTDATYQSSSALIADISRRWNIPLDRDHIIGHHQIYSLKTCPGFKVDLNKLISLASGSQEAGRIPADPVKTVKSGKAITRVRLNIRSKPDRSLPVITTVDPGVPLAYDGFSDQGENISGNSKWFFTVEGIWYWSGGVDSK
jgi:N-acetylmuramoyl-L-alanine amidase